MLVIGGGLAAAILLGAMLLLGSGGNNISKQLQHLALRMSTTQKLLEDPTVSKNLRNSDLSQAVTELNLSLVSSQNELRPLMTELGLPAEFDKSIVASEADTSSQAKLSEAAVNNQFDEVYAETLGQKIVSLRALVAETYAQTKNAKLREALVRLDKSLNVAKKNLDKITF